MTSYKLIVKILELRILWLEAFEIRRRQCKNTQKTNWYTKEPRTPPRTKSLWLLFARAMLISVFFLQGICPCNQPSISNLPILTCLKNMLWEAELGHFLLGPQHGFLSHNVHDISCVFPFEDKSRKQWFLAESDLRLISLCSWP
jgi:hypothetical protein